MAASKLLAGLLAANLAVGGTVVVRRSTDEPGTRVTAHFTRTVGLYAGSSVRVLGVKIGKVVEIVPDGPSVRVELELDPDVKVPADARAVIIPPSLVSDRYVQLVPPYTGGPTIPDGADIPVSRTRTPVELDEILASMDKLLVALGPNGANADGSLSELVDAGANALGGGNGERLHTTLTALARAMTALADGKEDLAGVIENLAGFTHTLATNDAKVRALTRDLATVSEQLAGERQSLEQAMKNLAISLGEIAELVKVNRVTLGEDVDTLAAVTQRVLKQRASLVEALDTTPLHLANLAETINTERGTLDIRNDNDQTSNGYDILICQVLAPILDIDCPPPPGGTPGKRPVPAPGAPNARPSTMRRPAPATVPFDAFTLRGMLEGARR